jgi:hypothetical protein
MTKRALYRLPKVKIPDLSFDELKGIDRAEVLALSNKLRRGMIDENR